MGITFARQAGELKIPAVQVGINVEAQKDGFWEATKGMGNYVMTMNTYARGVEYNELTKPFVDTYHQEIRRDPHLHGRHLYRHHLGLVPVHREAVGSLDADKIVAHHGKPRIPGPLREWSNT